MNAKHTSFSSLFYVPIPGMLHNRGVQDICTPPVLRRGQSNPAHQTPVACAYSVCHGYGHSHGIHFLRTPPLCICGIQNFVYASDHYYSCYELFPSSAQSLLHEPFGSARFDLYESCQAGMPNTYRDHIKHEPLSPIITQIFQLKCSRRADLETSHYPCGLKYLLWHAPKNIFRHLLQSCIDP
jgi:hypothetical protein